MWEIHIKGLDTKDKNIKFYEDEDFLYMFKDGREIATYTKAVSYDELKKAYLEASR